MTNRKQYLIPVLKPYFELLQNHTDKPIQSNKGSTDFSHLLWMLNYILENSESMPYGKLNRWLGFIQGCLITRGLLTVEYERDRTRPYLQALDKVG